LQKADCFQIKLRPLLKVFHIQSYLELLDKYQFVVPNHFSTHVFAVWFIDIGTAYLLIGFDIRHNKFDYNDQLQEQKKYYQTKVFSWLLSKKRFKAKSVYSTRICE
jgi:hypothetical protein